MAGGAEFTKGAFSFAGPLKGLFNEGRKAAGGLTAAERQADEAQQKKIQAAEDELALKKQVAAANNAAANSAINEINGQASDAEIAQVLQMLKNGMSPEEISQTMGYDGRSEGADLSMFGGPAPQGAPTPAQTQAPAAATQPRGLRQALASNPNIDWGAIGGPITDGYGETYNLDANGEYRNANGEKYTGNTGGRSFEGDSPTGATGVSRDPMLGQEGQDPNLRYAIDEKTGGYTPGKTRVEFGQPGGNTGYVPRGYEDKAASGGGLSDYSPEEIAKATALASKGKWSQMGEYGKVLDAKKGIYQKLSDAMNGIVDPEAAAAQKDLENKALRSDQTRGQQQFAMDKLKGLTDVKETAEERLMREVARRNQENQMVSQRKATLGNLAARGQLGSGAELASMLGAQASTSSNRVLDEMAANANAQKRAIDALGKYGDMGVALGGQDITEGAHANQTGQFNNQLNEQHNQFVTKNQQENNRAKERRSSTLADAGNDVANTLERQTGNRVSTIGNNAALKIGTATGGVNMVAPASKSYADAYANEAERRLAEEDAQGGGLL